MSKVIVILAGAVLFAAALGIGRMAAPADDAAAHAPTTTERTTTAARARPRPARPARREPGEDVRGPCDEAEHAADPRCIGAAAGRNDDDGRRRGGDDRDDDRSGSNRGRGGGDD